MNQKHTIAMWCSIAAVVLLSILGRILFPVYRDVFHGVIALMFLVALLTGRALFSSEAAEHKAGILTAARERRRRPRKRSAQKMRKRKRPSGR